jgi:hypothetical protein
MADSSFKIRRATIILAALLVAVALYTGWWFSIAIHLEENFHTWQAGLGQNATAQARTSVSGYPFSVSLHARNFTYEKPGILKVTTPNLIIRLRPWTPFRPTAKSDEPTVFQFIKSDYTVTAQRFEMSFVKPWIGPNSTHDTGLVVSAHFFELVLDAKKPFPLGNNVAEISITTKIKGTPPDVFSAAALNAWRDAGGVAEIPWLKTIWGPLSFEGAGTYAIDKAFQPLAAFNGRVSGYDKAIDALRDSGQIKPLVASLFKAALKLLENQKKNHDEEPSVSVPVTVQSSSLSVAGVVLAKWDPFPWP